MSNITNYSLFFITELKHRLLYVLCSCIIIMVYSLFYINDFIIQLLQPIEYLNLDLNTTVLTKFLLLNLSSSMYDINKLNNEALFFLYSDNIIFDYYPVFEINITNNNVLYLTMFVYITILFVFPLVLYHMFLFFLPGFYLHEFYVWVKLFFFFLCVTMCYINYVHFFFIFFILCVTYNNFYEYYNYEFDIEFNLLEYINLNITLLLLCYLNSIICIFFIYYYNSRKHILFFKTILYVLNIYFFVSFFVFFFFISIFYLLCYILMLYNETKQSKVAYKEALCKAYNKKKNVHSFIYTW